MGRSNGGSQRVRRGPYCGPELNNHQRWLSIWSYARIDLGLSEAEFWQLNSRSLCWLGKRFKAKLQRQEQAVGLICSAIANHGMRSPRKWALPADYMPSELVRKARLRSEQGTDDVAGAVRELMTDYMG